MTGCAGHLQEKGEGAAFMKANRLQFGDTIGIISPCIATQPENIAQALEVLKAKDFRIRLGKNLYKNTYGYAASLEERADDFNAMISDKEVKMILFGGGEVCNEILPLVDFAAVRENPKIVCSYSDSTTLLDSLYAMTCLVTFYGASLRTFANISDYNFDSFQSRLMRANIESFKRSGEWNIIHSGVCTGVLLGGYLANFAMMISGPHFPYDKGEKYIMFIEDHLKFNNPAAVSKYFSHIEQSGFFEQVTGVIMGHYGDASEEVTQILHRLAERHHVPVIRCEDFGHGENNAILPIGIKATLDTDSGTLTFLENTVI
jgi:muramoyltetrapeptide carboxypeptidase